MFCKLAVGTRLAKTPTILVRTFKQYNDPPNNSNSPVSSTNQPNSAVPINSRHLLHNHPVRPGYVLQSARGFRSTDEGSASVRSTRGGGGATKSAAAATATETAPSPLSAAVDDMLGAAESIVPVSLANIRKTIRAGGLDLTDGYCCMRTTCPMCADANRQPATPPPGKRADKTVDGCAVFINKTTGTVVCPTCQMVRSWPAMEAGFQRPSANASAKAVRDFELLRQHFVKSKEPRAECQPDAEAQPMKGLAAELVQSVLRHLQLDMFAAEMFEALGALCNAGEKSLHLPLHDANGATVGYKILQWLDDDAQLVERTVPDSNCFGVLCSAPKSQREAANAVVVLNVVDLLALASQKLPSSIVCLPHGSKSLPQHCLPALERFSRLTLWFHNDTVSWDTARTFAKKLDERRCVFVRPTESHPAPAAAHRDGLDVRQVLASAQPVLHKAITTFAALRQDVLSEIQNIDKVQGVKWRRFPVLNKLLKGHRKGELTILTGPTGCGKTTFMSEYSLDLTMQGVTTLWGSFEIRNTRLASTLLRQLAGHPFDERLDEFDRWANEFERLPMYFMTFHGQQSIKVVMETIEHAQYVHDIQHVIIDNVQFMMGTADEPKHVDRFWRQDAIIAAFRTFATKKNCHVTLVIHPRKERDADDLTTSSIFGGAKATQEADNVLIIQDKRLTAIRGKKYLQVAKNRYSGDLGIMPMEFDKLALSYAQPVTVPRKKKTDEEETGAGSTQEPAVSIVA